MNLGLLMGVSSPSMPMNTSASSANVEGEAFGSVFQSLMATTSIPAKQQTVDTDAEMTKLLGEVLNAESLEELAGILEKLEQSGKSPIVAQLLKQAGLRQTISVNEKTVEKILSGITGEKNEVQEAPVKEAIVQVLPKQADQADDASVELTKNAEKLLSELLSKVEKLIPSDQTKPSLIEETILSEAISKSGNVVSTEQIELGKVKETLLSGMTPKVGKAVPTEQIELGKVKENLLSELTSKLESATSAEHIKPVVVEEILLSKELVSDISAELSLTDLPDLQKFPSLQQLASLITENPDKLVDTITNVLQDAGVTKEQLDQIAATGDIWFVLDVLQQLPAEKVQAALEQLVPKVAVELTALLKAVELAAPKMDLFTKQADLVKTIQPILSQFANQLEQKTIQPEVKQPVQIPPAMQHMIRFTTEQSAADTKQQDQQSKPSEAVTPQSAITQSEVRPVFQMTAAEKVPESRSEALMKEFQAILNRANFGQTNGMNRISIKLYPEHLGQIRIELLEVNGVMTARILASTAMAREMLDSKMHQLRHAFNQQNLQVDRIDLSQTLQESSKSDREQAFNKQNQQQKEQATKQNEQQDENEQTFQEFMIELEA